MEWRHGPGSDAARKAVAHHELATIAHYRLNIPIVIFNNGGYKILNNTQRKRYGRTIGTELTNPDFVKQLEAEAKELMTRMKAKTTVTAVETPLPASAKGDAEARDLMDKSLEIARLEAQIRREMQAYQERPKRKFVGARAQESRFALYVDTWRQKVERIGNLNYPREAQRLAVHKRWNLVANVRLAAFAALAAATWSAAGSSE